MSGLVPRLVSCSAPCRMAELRVLSPWSLACTAASGDGAGSQRINAMCIASDDVDVRLSSSIRFASTFAQRFRALRCRRRGSRATLAIPNARPVDVAELRTACACQKSFRWRAKPACCRAVTTPLTHDGNGSDRSIRSAMRPTAGLRGHPLSRDAPCGRLPVRGVAKRTDRVPNGPVRRGAGISVGRP